MTTTQQKPVQGHNGALDDDAFESKALRQLAKMTPFRRTLFTILR